MGIHDRLKTERERLKHSQATFALMAGVTRNSQINWEKGESAPTAVQLARLAVMGVDVLYVITGNRSKPLPPDKVLPPDEQSLLDTYRACDKTGKSLIKSVSDTAALEARVPVPNTPCRQAA